MKRSFAIKMKLIIPSVIVALLSMGAAYRYYTPVPPGLNNRIALGSVFAFQKFMTDIIKDQLYDGVPVRLYIPDGQENQYYPGIVYYHGGGWVYFNIEYYHAMCAKLAHDTQSIVVSVEYRLAPKHVFPAGYEDCYKATVYFAQIAAKHLPLDVSRITVMGDSAGGNLAAAVALGFRDNKIEPELRSQVLIYPALQMVDLRSPSRQSNRYGAVITNYDGTEFIWLYAIGNSRPDIFKAMDNNEHTSSKFKQIMASSYLNHDLIPLEVKVNYETTDTQTMSTLLARNYNSVNMTKGNETIWNEVKDIFTNPYFCPLLAKSVANLPEAYIFSAQYDILRDDSFWYAHRLREENIKVTHVNAKDGYHGMLTWDLMFVDAAMGYYNQIVEYLNTL